MQYTEDALKRNLELIAFGTWQAVLIDAASFDPTNPTMLDVIRSELIVGSNYARQPIPIGATTFNGDLQRAEKPAIDAVFSVPANAAAISYNYLAVLSGGASAIANRSVSAIDPTANTLSFAGSSGLTNGDKVVLTARSGGVVPSALLNAGNPQILFVVNATGNTVQLALTAGGTPIDFGAGTLPIDCRFANGQVEAIESPGSQQILPGNSRTYRIPITHGNSN